MAQPLDESLTPFQDLCVDESLVFFKGQQNFKQYVKAKGHRFAIMFTSSVTETGNVSNVWVFTVKDTNI
jgi:hypothetical protein